MANELVSKMWAYGSTSLPEDDVNQWKSWVRGTAPSNTRLHADGDVNVDPVSKLATIIIIWSSPTRSPLETNRYVTKVVIP